MTIIRPNQDKDLKRITFFCLLGLTAMLLGVLISYINFVNTTHNLQKIRAGLEEMKVQNAELKNQSFQLTSSENIEAFASEMGLIKDKSPEWVLASQ